MEELLESFNVCRSDLIETANRFGIRKDQPKHSTFTLGCHRNARIGCSSRQTVDQLLRFRGQRFVESRCINLLQRGETSRHRYWISRECTGLINRAVRGETRHDVSATTKGRRGHSTADNLAERRQIRSYPEDRLGAAFRHTKSCHHFIKYQDRSRCSAKFAQLLVEARHRWHHVHVARDRLDNHTGDLFTDFRKYGVQCIKIIVGQGNRVLREAGRYARRAGHAQRQGTGACFD